MDEEKEKITVEAYSEVEVFAECPSCQEANKVCGDAYNDVVMVICAFCDEDFNATWDGK